MILFIVIVIAIVAFYVFFVVYCCSAIDEYYSLKQYKRESKLRKLMWENRIKKEVDAFGLFADIKIGEIQSRTSGAEK